MQIRDHYFTTQICIFLLFNNLTDSFSFALQNPIFRMSLWHHTSEKTEGMFNWRNYILGEISLLLYIWLKFMHKLVSIVCIDPWPVAWVVRVDLGLPWYGLAKNRQMTTLFTMKTVKQLNQIYFRFASVYPVFRYIYYFRLNRNCCWDKKKINEKLFLNRMWFPNFQFCWGIYKFLTFLMALYLGMIILIFQFLLLLLYCLTGQDLGERGDPVFQMSRLTFDTR